MRRERMQILHFYNSVPFRLTKHVTCLTTDEAKRIETPETIDGRRGYKRRVKTSKQTEKIARSFGKPAVLEQNQPRVRRLLGLRARVFYRNTTAILYCTYNNRPVIDQREPSPRSLAQHPIRFETPFQEESNTLQYNNGFIHTCRYFHAYLSTKLLAVREESLLLLIYTTCTKQTETYIGTKKRKKRALRFDRESNAHEKKTFERNDLHLHSGMHFSPFFNYNCCCHYYYY